MCAFFVVVLGVFLCSCIRMHWECFAALTMKIKKTWPKNEFQYYSQLYRVVTMGCIKNQNVAGEVPHLFSDHENLRA